MAQQHFSFRIINMPLVWSSTAAIPLLVLGSVFIIAEAHLAIGWAIAFAISLLIALTVLLLRYGFRPEQITLDKYYITSDRYGEIHLTDIKKAYSPWAYTKPSLKLKLKGRRSVAWYLNSNNRGLLSNTKEDLDIFWSFLAALEAHMAKLDGNKIPSQPLTVTKKQLANTPSVSGQLKDISSKTGKITWAVPLGFIFAVIMLIRACGPKWFGSQPDIGKLKRSSEYMFNYYRQEMQDSIRERMKTEGELFLYTNDTAATLTLLPRINTDNPLNIELFKYSQANADMRKFLDSPRTATLYTYLIAGDSAVIRLHKGITSYEDSSDQQLLLCAYDPEQRIKISRLSDDTTTRPFRVNWGIPLHDTTKLTSAFANSFPGMHLLLAQAKLRPSFHIYMVGQTRHGISSDRFRTAIYELNRLLHKSKVDTNTFHWKIENRQP